MDVTVLTLPGWQDSGPAHWQSPWEATHSGVRRVVQDEWDEPDCDAWIERLDETIADVGHEVVLAAHSLGCILVARWAVLSERPVRGALLVAVPDPLGPNFPARASGFWLPTGRLAFPSVVVARSDDPYAGATVSEEIAAGLGSHLVRLGPLGHINGDSGLGEWPDGWAMVTQLCGDPPTSNV